MAKIFSIDDSKAIRQLVSTILASIGHEVITASDGNEAMAIARNHKFDLVLSDVNMPGMNGISLVSKLRRLKGYEYIPIIMLTTEDKDYKNTKRKKLNQWAQRVG